MSNSSGYVSQSELGPLIDYKTQAAAGDKFKESAVQSLKIIGSKGTVRKPIKFNRGKPYIEIEDEHGSKQIIDLIEKTVGPPGPRGGAGKTGYNIKVGNNKFFKLSTKPADFEGVSVANKSNSPVGQDMNSILNRVMSGKYSSASEVEKAMKKNKISGKVAIETLFLNTKVVDSLKPKTKTDLGKMLGTSVTAISTKIIETFTGYKSPAQAAELGGKAGPTKVIKAKVTKFVKKTCVDSMESKHIGNKNHQIYKRKDLTKTDLSKAVTIAEAKFKASSDWNNECDLTFMKRVYKELRDMGYDVSSVGALSAKSTSPVRVPSPKQGSGPKLGSPIGNVDDLLGSSFGHRYRFGNSCNYLRKFGRK
jgi:hypothetical protein